MTAQSPAGKVAHTPGEWKFVQARQKTYATMTAAGKLLAIFRKPVSDEDGRLIAAAPDLLEALNAVLDYSGARSGYDAMRYGDAIERAEAAIAKAVGQ